MSTKRDKLRTTNRKAIQIILILLGFVLIATTYFIYPRLIQIPVQKKIAIDEDLKTEEALNIWDAAFPIYYKTAVPALTSKCPSEEATIFSPPAPS